ncbi:hypothetical protein ACVIHH_000102 [Bradyrhizobium sp. USDA 4518]
MRGRQLVRHLLIRAQVLSLMEMRMQGVLCGRQVSFLRASPIAHLARGSSVPSIQVRWTSSTRLIRRRAVISRGHLLVRLFRVARRPHSRRRRRTEDERRIRDSNSQDGEEKMTFLSAGSRRLMSELRRSSPAPPSWPTCSIPLESRRSTFRVSSRSTLRRSQASFGQDSRSLPFNLSRADLVIQGCFGRTIKTASRAQTIRRTTMR